MLSLLCAYMDGMFGLQLDTDMWQRLLDALKRDPTLLKVLMACVLQEWHMYDRSF